SIVGAWATHNRAAFGAVSVLTVSRSLPSASSCFHSSFGSGLPVICCRANTPRVLTTRCTSGLPALAFCARLCPELDTYITHLSPLSPSQYRLSASTVQ